MVDTNQKLLYQGHVPVSCADRILPRRRERLLLQVSTIRPRIAVKTISRPTTSFLLALLQENGNNVKGSERIVFNAL
jgi:hypothetical protein